MWGVFISNGIYGYFGARDSKIYCMACAILQRKVEQKSKNKDKV